MTTDTLHRKLQKLIGDRFDYIGEVWVLIEVLQDVDTVVLRRCDNCKPATLQANSYGIPNRRTVETLTLAISDRDGGYSQDLLVLLEGRQVKPGSS